ncbi:MAG TPA: helix-turn-helix domain-containing protein [Candidatus Sulfotelmatobacter sp.]|nr:helix-turn-helix domain-containing protein [Candidatus Sulfotelmatobacter sp.]
MSEVEVKTSSNVDGRQGASNEMGPAENQAVKHRLAGSELSLRFFRDEAEVLAISSALNKTGWNRKRAAQLLSISYRGLLYKIRRHNLAPPAEHS